MSNRKNAEAAAGKTTDRRRESLFAMRLFIAILLSEEMKKALTDAQQAMVDRGVRGRYSPEENLHLTLAFIGDYPDAQPVLDALNTVSFRPFDLSLEGIGCFGDLRWAGLKDSLPLAAVARRVRRALAETIIGGVSSTLPVQYLMMYNGAFLRGDYDTGFLEENLDQLVKMCSAVDAAGAAGAAEEVK